MKRIKRIVIIKEPVKVTSLSLQGGTLRELGYMAKRMGYTKSALSDKVLKEWLEDELTEIAQSEQDDE